MESAELEIISAKEQLQMFTSNLIEKTILVEKLEQRATHKAGFLRAAGHYI